MTPEMRQIAIGQGELASTSTPERLQDLLIRTSRTFALNIPLLPEPTRCEVTVAYLLFRIADTLEDATNWPSRRKLDELRRFERLLDGLDQAAAIELAGRWSEEPPCDHDGYRELLAELPLVLRTTRELADGARGLVVAHTLRTIRGMSAFLAREPGSELRLRDVQELREYCYAVAGIVGEMLTELFLGGNAQLQPVAPILRGLAPTFGEALQLVNILKDAEGDSQEGRHFLPVAGRTATEVFSLAREDLDGAARYVICLAQAGAPRGLVAFTALPLLLAIATLDRVEQEGPGSKISRDEVARTVERLNRALDQDTVRTLFDRP